MHKVSLSVQSGISFGTNTDLKQIFVWLSIFQKVIDIFTYLSFGKKNPILVTVLKTVQFSFNFL